MGEANWQGRATVGRRRHFKRGACVPSGSLRSLSTGCYIRTGALACVVSLAGCIIDNDRVRIESFTYDPAGTFVFTAQTNTVMTANDDGEAEQIRRGWLGEELIVHNVCTAGYVIETRQLAEPSDAPSSNAHDVVYSGRCL